MRIATLGAPVLPVTSASPLVMETASTLPAENASIDGEYSNHFSSTLTPSSLNHPFCSAMSQATHPGQSLYAIFSAGPVGVGGVGAALALAAAVATGASDAAGLV